MKRTSRQTQEPHDMEDGESDGSTGRYPLVAQLAPCRGKTKTLVQTH